MLSNQQFERTRRFALNLAGIELVERHRELLGHRSRRLGILDSAGFESLLDAAEAGDAGARQRLFSLLTTKFTGFFRHPRHFELAADQALRAVRQRGRTRLWSAAAATGEEPYSLAMVLIEAFARNEPPGDVLATDVDAESLAAAQRGEYGELALRALTPARRARFVSETSDSRRWVVAPEVRRLVEFRPLNLASPNWAVEGPCDVILCRNVLMYLGVSHRYGVLERLASLLASDGLLMLDPAEHLGKAGRLFTPVADGVYSRRRASSSGSGAVLTAALAHS
jgi:chemotaxis protein methyltransferase CheR